MRIFVAFLEKFLTRQGKYITFDLILIKGVLPFLSNKYSPEGCEDILILVFTGYLLLRYVEEH